MRLFQRICSAALVVAFLAGGAGTAAAAPEPDLWPRWEAHNPGSTLMVDHGPFDAFLAKYLKDDPDGLNRLDYAGVTDADKSALDAYVAALAATPVSTLTRPEQFAYWVNLYNALTVKVVLDHFPVESIREISISPGLFSSGPWGAKLLEIEGEEVSLDDIEHRILRPIWRDPRIHYAVNCASVGCPDLISKAYRADGIDAQLDANARAYVNSPRGAAFDGDGDLVVSKIYDWFDEDFDGTEAGIIDHLSLYAEGPLKQKLQSATSIGDYVYDWSLNRAE